MSSTGAATAYPPATLRRARTGTAFTFALAAAISAVWIVGTPALVDKLDLNPAKVGIAGDIDPPRAAASIALAGTLGYTGMLLGPVVIGLLADATTLRAALFVAVGLGLAIAVAGRLLPKQWRVRGHDAPLLARSAGEPVRRR